MWITPKMLSLIPGESQVFLSTDTVIPIENDDPIEKMNPLEYYTL